MNIEKIRCDRCPESDHLFKVSEASKPEKYVRVRVQRIEQGTVASVLAKDALEFSVQCALAREDGDLVKDALGHNVILGQEVHSVSLDALASGQLSMLAWLGSLIEESVVKTARKAFFILDLAPGLVPSRPVGSV
jgi:hypothetical protein